MHSTASTTGTTASPAGRSPARWLLAVLLAAACAAPAGAAASMHDRAIPSARRKGTERRGDKAMMIQRKMKWPAA